MPQVTLRHHSRPALAFRSVARLAGFSCTAALLLAGCAPTVVVRSPDAKPASITVRPAPAGDAVVRDNNRSVTLQCAGRSVMIEGNANRVTLQGSCEDVVVRGNANTVNAEGARDIEVRGNSNTLSVSGISDEISLRGNNNRVAVIAARSVEVQGNNNRVTWAPASPRPKVTSSGNNNTFTR